MDLRSMMISERSQTRGYTLYDPIYVTFWKKQNYRVRNQISDC